MNNEVIISNNNNPRFVSFSKQGVPNNYMDIKRNRRKFTFNRKEQENHPLAFALQNSSRTNSFHELTATHALNLIWIWFQSDTD